MKKFLFLFILSVSFLPGFKTANAQLEYYHFLFNIYDNGERISDSNIFNVTMNIYDRENPDSLVRIHSMQLKDSSENHGFDYSCFKSADLFFRRTGEIIIKNGTDIMKIILDNPQASAWITIGIEKIDFKIGTFKITQEYWPQKRKVRPQNNEGYYYIDENFDWNKIKL